MKILIATWGDPTTWSEVTYYIDGKAFKSKTTYIPIFVIEKPDKGIVLIQNSLITKLNLEDTNLDEISKLKEFIKEKLEEFVNSTQSIQEDIKDKIIKDTETLVIISSGYFNYNNINRIKFEADFYDILLNVFLELYFYIKDNRPDEIILDLTHGINYFTTITLTALSYLKKIFNFKLKIYNATPVTKGINEAFILNLGEVSLEGKMLIKIDNLLETYRKLKSIYREKIDFKIKPAFDLIVSYVYGLVFPLIDKSNLDIDINIIKSFIPRQKRENTEYKLESNLKNSGVRSKDLFEFIFTLLLAREISSKFSMLAKDKRTIDIDSIRYIIDNLSNKVAKIIVEKEYENLKKIYENSDIIFKDRDSIRYKEALYLIRSYEIGETNIRSTETNRRVQHSESEKIRNFFAHASLLWDKVILYKDKKIKYIENYEDILEKIKEVEI